MLEVAPIIDRLPRLDPLPLDSISVLSRQPPHQESVWQLLRRYGEYGTYQVPSGDLVTVLPTSRVPWAYFIRDNWRRTIPMGNFRVVESIEGLIDGTYPRLIVKSPERCFTKDGNKLQKGYPWWGGRRSGEKRVFISGNPIVEEQSVWEAIILLELHKLGINAEIPQALIQTNSGDRCLVVNRIPEPKAYCRSAPVKLQEPGYEQIRDLIKTETNLCPEDLASHNCLIDINGRAHIIDVNRWTWPPFTNDYRDRLLTVLSKAS